MCANFGFGALVRGCDSVWECGVTVAMAAKSTDAIFTANRAVGHASFAVKAAHGATRRARVREHGSLRVRFPGPAADELEAVLVNTAGGIAGGDCFAVDVRAGKDTRLVVGTAAAEKIYRTLAPAARIDVTLDLAAGAALAWLPQETILFDRARLARTIDVAMAPDASLLLAEAVVFGRSGMGEAVEQGALSDRWRVRRDGKLIYAETVRLDGAIATRLSEPAVANGGIAVATILVIPGAAATVAAVRAMEGQFCGEVGASAWSGLAVVRLCAADGATLRRDLIKVLMALRGALPRLWLN
jgi:urease accessory protein